MWTINLISPTAGFIEYRSEEGRRWVLRRSETGMPFTLAPEGVLRHRHPVADHLQQMPLPPRNPECQLTCDVRRFLTAQQSQSVQHPVAGYDASEMLDLDLPSSLTGFIECRHCGDMVQGKDTVVFTVPNGNRVQFRDVSCGHCRTTQNAKPSEEHGDLVYCNDCNETIRVPAGSDYCWHCGTRGALTDV